MFLSSHYIQFPGGLTVLCPQQNYADSGEPGGAEETPSGQKHRIGHQPSEVIEDKKETKHKASLVSKAACHHPVNKSPLEVYACTAI